MTHFSDHVHLNQLLLHFDDDRLSPFVDNFEAVALPRGAILDEAETIATHAYFIETGVTVLTAYRGDRLGTVGVLGRESVSPPQGHLGDSWSAYTSTAATDVRAWQLPLPSLWAAMKASVELQLHMQRQAFAFHLQVGDTAIANGGFTIVPRLARWLLVLTDCAAEGHISLTHDTLAAMLSVQRPGITVALQVLERRGLVRATRGRVEILDRARLSLATLGSYRQPLAIPSSQRHS